MDDVWDEEGKGSRVKGNDWMSQCVWVCGRA